VAFGFDDERVRDWVDENATRRQSRFYQRCEHLFQETSLIDDLGAEVPFPNRSLQAIDAPTLAIYGDGSDILDRARDLEANLPHCELLVLEDCEHRVLVDRPADVRSRTLDWVGRHAAPAVAAGAGGAAPSAGASARG
jgi:pimeloyl-ACP methyl ester carboxylesterase